MTATKKTGIELIAEERQRQLEELNHDSTRIEDQDLYDQGQCVMAALAYIHKCRDRWPEDWNTRFRAKDDITNLKKAGAMLAAEIDRLQSISDTRILADRSKEQ